MTPDGGCGKVPVVKGTMMTKSDTLENFISERVTEQVVISTMKMRGLTPPCARGGNTMAIKARRNNEFHKVKNELDARATAEFDLRYLTTSE